MSEKLKNGDLDLLEKFIKATGGQKRADVPPYTVNNLKRLTELIRGEMGHLEEKRRRLDPQKVKEEIDRLQNLIDKYEEAVRKLLFNTVSRETDSDQALKTLKDAKGDEIPPMTLNQLEELYTLLRKQIDVLEAKKDEKNALIRKHIKTLQEERTKKITLTRKDNEKFISTLKTKRTNLTYCKNAAELLKELEPEEDFEITLGPKDITPRDRIGWRSVIYDYDDPEKAERIRRLINARISCIKIKMRAQSRVNSWGGLKRVREGGLFSLLAVITGNEFFPVLGPGICAREELEEEELCVREELEEEELGKIYVEDDTFCRNKEELQKICAEDYAVSNLLKTPYQIDYQAYSGCRVPAILELCYKITVRIKNCLDCKKNPQDIDAKTAALRANKEITKLDKEIDAKTTTLESNEEIDKLDKEIESKTVTLESNKEIAKLDKEIEQYEIMIQKLLIQ